MPPGLAEALRDMGEHIARMRKARHVLQADAALRANISREWMPWSLRKTSWQTGLRSIFPATRHHEFPYR